MGKLGTFFQTIKDKWQSQSRIKKIIWILAILSVLFVSGTVYYLETRVQYGVLFTGLSEGDAGTIADELKQEDVAYKLADNGQTILVDKTKVDQVRIELAEDDKLPDSSQGFELFDNTNVMTTDADRRITYQRALTGELEKSIDALNQVQSSKVNLVTTENSVFDDSDDGNSSKPAKASIVLTLKSYGISNEAVQGIVALTAGAVQNLSERNIKVVDSNGNVLFNGKKSSSNLVSSNSKYLSITKKYEAALQNKILHMLEPIYGKNRVKASVNLNLNFDSVKNKTVNYSNPQIRSEKTATATNGAATSSTQTGEANNSATNASGSSNDNASSSSSQIVNNELNTSTTNTITAPGSIQQMTASVVIDKNLSAANRKKIKKLISSAIGYNQGRGDTIQVQSINFARKQRAKVRKKNKTSRGWNIWAYIGLGIALLLLIATIVFLVIHFRHNRLDKEILEDYEKQNAPKPNVTAETTETPKVKVEKPKKESKESKAQILDRKAREYAKEHPDEVADLIKAWLKEDKG